MGVDQILNGRAVEVQSATVKDLLDAGAIETGSLNTNDATVTNAPTNANDVARRGELTQNGTATLTDGGSVGAAADDGWDSRTVDVVTVTFDEAFASTPQIATVIDIDQSDNTKGIVTEVQKRTTTGFDIVYRNYSTKDHASQNNTISSTWIATDGRP